MKKLLVYSALLLVILQSSLAQDSGGSNPFDDANYIPSFEIDDEGNPISDYEQIMREIDELNELVDTDEEPIPVDDTIPEPPPETVVQKDNASEDVSSVDTDEEPVIDEPVTTENEEATVTKEDMEKAIALRDFLRERYEQQTAGDLPQVNPVEVIVIEDPRENEIQAPKRKPRLQSIMSRRINFPEASIESLSDSENNVIEKIVEHELAHISDREGAFSAVASAAYETVKEIEVRRTYQVVEGSTKITVTIIPKKPLYDFSIYEEIPKSVAGEAANIIFYTSNYDVLEEDPLIVWKFDEVESSVTVSYIIDKELTEEEFQSITVIPVAERVGITLQNFVPIMAVPIIGIIIISFNHLRFTQRKKKVSKNLIEFIRKARKRKMTDAQISAQLKKAGWSNKLIDSALKQSG